MIRLFNIAAALSFTGFVLTCLAWGLTSSRFMPQGFELPHVSFRQGWFEAGWGWSDAAPSCFGYHTTTHFGGTLSWTHEVQFDGELAYLGLGVKLWLPVAAFAILPAIWLAFGGRRRRAHRRKLGLCEKCGYDLRGSPEPRCPECGMGS